MGEFVQTNSNLDSDLIDEIVCKGEFEDFNPKKFTKFNVQFDIWNS